MAGERLTAVWFDERGQVEHAAEFAGLGSILDRGVLWIDVGESTDWDGLAATLEKMDLPGFNRSMLGYVLSGLVPGEPGSAQVGWHDEAVERQLLAGGVARVVRAHALAPEFPEAPIDMPWMFNQRVMLLVGGAWLITARHRGLAVTLGAAQQGEALERESLQRSVSKGWTSSFRYPGDIAMLMLRGLAETLDPALQRVERRLEYAQLGYVRSVDDPAGGDLDVESYREELIAMTWVVDGVARTVADMARPGQDLRDAWVSIVDAEPSALQVRELLDRARSHATRLRQVVRESFDLAAGMESSRNLALAYANQRRGAALQRAVSLVGAVLLAPGLIATVFGALPAIFDGCPLARTALLLALMVGAGVGTWLVLQGIEPSDDEP